MGLPSIVMQSIATPMTMGINKILTGLNEVAVSVFGVYFKLQSFVFMPVFGLTNGMVPIDRSSPENIRHFMELRGVGIINARRLFGIGAVKMDHRPWLAFGDGPHFLHGHEGGRSLRAGSHRRNEHFHCRHVARIHGGRQREKETR